VPDDRLSVIIPALNEEARISACIASAFLVGADEVIVADGGSTDATCDLAMVSGARVIHSKRGRGVQLNAGVQAATGDILLFLHADSVLPRVSKKEMVALLDRVGAGYFRLCFDSSVWSVRLVALAANLRSSLLSLPYGDQGLFFRRELFERVGGFLPSPFLEDLDCVLKLKKQVTLQAMPSCITVSSRQLLKPFPLAPIVISLRNVAIALLFLGGVSPERLIKLYR
jgi:rSAM/selenodomain-associated transferase 2